MSGQNIRNVPVRRNIGSSSTCHTVTESYEHHQSNLPSACQPEDTGRGGERTGEEARGRTQGILWGECIALYHKSLYIMHWALRQERLIASIILIRSITRLHI